MKIRNLDKYLHERVGKSYFDDNSLIGKSDELLKSLYGEVLSKKKFKTNIIQTLTSFASDTAYDQVFYEFLQNAKDAKADSFWIYYEDRGGLIFMNNGESFHTLPPLLKEGEEEELPGSVFSFLGKGKGVKADNPEYSGKYGKGSKLIFNLLVPASDEEGSSIGRFERMAPAIIEDSKAPILFSWNESQHLDQILEINKIDEFVRDDDLSNEGCPILCMLYLSYFPALPKQALLLKGDDQEVIPFNHQVFDEFKNFLQKVTSNFQNKQLFMKPGSLIYVPAPASVISEIKNQEDGIIGGVQLSYTLLNQEGKLKNVFFNNRFIEKTKNRQFQFSFVDEKVGENFVASIIFENEPKFIKNSPNIFIDYFPVSQEKHNLAYTIQCSEFKVTEDRQRLRDNSGLFLLLKNAFIRDWSKWLKNTEEYNSFVKAVLLSQEPDENPVKELHLSIVEKVQQNIPTNCGNFKTIDEVVVLPKSFRSLKPLDFGITKFSIHHDLVNCAEQLEENWDIKVWSLTKFFSEADISILNKYFRNLNNVLLNEVWKQLEKECEKNRNLLCSIPFIPLNNGAFASINDFREEGNYFLCWPDTNFSHLRGSLVKYGIFVNLGIEVATFLDENSFPNIYEFISKKWPPNEIKYKIKEWAKRDLIVSDEDKLKVVQTCLLFDQKNEQNILQNFFQSKACFFCNGNDEKQPLNQMLPNISENHSFTYPWSIKYQNGGEILNKLLAPKEDWWDIIAEDHHFLEQQLHLNDNCEDLIKSLEFIIQAYRDQEDCNDALPGDIKWILNVQSEWINLDRCFYTPKMSELPVEEYLVIGNFIKGSDYELIHYDLLKYLQGKDELKKLLGCKSIEKWSFDPFLASKQEVEILKKWCDIEKSDFFYNFQLVENINEFIVEKKGNKVQFYSIDMKLKEFLNAKQDYNSLPESLYALFDEEIKDIENTNLKSSSDPSFLRAIISLFGADCELIDSVFNSYDARIKTEFIGKIEDLKLYLDREEYAEDSYEVKLIKMALKEDYHAQLALKIQLNDIRLKDINYQDTVSYQNKVFYLVDLLPHDNIKAGEIKRIKELLSHAGTNSELDRIFHLNSMDPDAVFNKIIQRKVVNAIQISFLLKYAECNNMEESALSGTTGILEVPVGEVLDACFRIEQILSKHWEALTPSFIPSKQVIPFHPNLWMKSEIVPQEVVDWIQSDLEKQKYINQTLILSAYVSKTESFRKIVIDRKKIDMDLPDRMKNKSLEWLVETQHTFDTKSKELLYLWLKEKELVIQYVISLDNIDDHLGLFFCLSRVEDQKLVYSITPSLLKHYQYLNLSRKVNVSSIVWVEDDKDYANQNWKKLDFKDEFSSHANIDRNEWQVDYYHSWKCRKDNNRKYIIWMTSGKIPFNYYLLSNGEILESLGCYDDENLARHDNNDTIELYLSEEIIENRSILQCLEECQNILFPGMKDKEDLVRLMSMANFENEKNVKVLEQHNIKSSKHLEKILRNNALGGISDSKGEGNIFLKDLDKLSNPELVLKSWPFLKDLIEKYGEEALERLDDALRKKKQEATPSFLSGYIGEQLCKSYLSGRSESALAEWVGDREWSYDILWDKKPVEVKTKVGTLYDDPNAGTGTTAVYLRRSQFDYIEEHGNQDYFLLLLSLLDLNIKDKYEEWKGMLPNGAKELTADLKKKIDVFAETFMQSPDHVDRFRKSVKFIRLEDAKKNN